jgi:hypothetical protein
MNSLRELAQQFVDEGLFGPIPESIKNHIDYDSIARDLTYGITSRSRPCFSGIAPIRMSRRACRS